MPVKILFVINQLYKGGAETNLVNLLNALSPQEHQVDLLVYDQLDLPEAVSLLPRVPAYVNLCNAAENEHGRAFLKKALSRIVRDASGKQLYRDACYRFVRGKHYDVAISYGEWISPEFVARHVCADRKIVWIHSDIDKAQFFNAEIMFRFHHEISLYLFPSQRSMQEALLRYPMLQGRAAVVHNLCDDDAIRFQAEQPAPEADAWKKPLLITVANFRREKNHLRQVEAMALLKKRGLSFTWVNIGSDTDTALLGQIRAAVKRHGLQENFLCLPAEENPYRLMRAADAVCVLSDFESWSMVISEAKVLGVPVIATKTSGALEQLADGETGILCDFSAQAIAAAIQRFLSDKPLQARIRRNLEGFSTRSIAVREFETELAACCAGKRPSLLYISDNINYVSGVQRVTATQIQALRNAFDITVFSMEPPDERSKRLFSGIPIMDLETCNGISCLSLKIWKVLFGRGYTLRQRAIRLMFGVLRKLGKEEWAMKRLAGERTREYFERFDTVCVLSEGSQLRQQVSELRHPRKIQWIHTDYALWSDWSDWTRQITANDGELYKHFDHVVCLTELSRQGFVQKYPHLAEKVLVIRNLQPVAEIREKSQAPLAVPGFQPDTINIVSVCRMDREKAVERILAVVQRLKAEGLRFHWYFAGDGVMLPEWQTLCRKLKLESHVTFLGNMENPYPLMKAASLFALLSKYEGLPVTIDEALILGTPVFATKVGGIPEQVRSDQNGLLVENDEQAIEQALCMILTQPEHLVQWRDNLRGAQVDNSAQIIGQLERLFGKGDE